MNRKVQPARAGGKRYRQVAEALLEEIRAGRLAVGDNLPGEVELTASFKVSRHTVREALRRLEELGLIGRRQGVGTVVLARSPTESYVQAVRTPAALLQYPSGSRLVVKATQRVRTGRALARLLGCKTGMEWLQVSCLRQFDDSRPPICWVDLYLLPEHERIVAQIGRRAGLVHELIEQQFGRQVATVEIAIMARSVPSRFSEALGVEPGTPSLTVVRRYSGPGRDLYLVSVSEHPGDRFTYSLSLERGWQAGGGAVWSSR
jgi:DNA-binding GntR family transcriptional regulator